MIESISISNVATYDSTPVVIQGLSKLNFFYGANGTGKTTLSRVIADETKFSGCNIRWKAGTQLPSLVYNSDFIEKNFNQPTELKGVFTLGEQQVETLEKIAKAKEEVRQLTNVIQSVTRTLQGDDGNGGKKGDLVRLESNLKDKCWAQKQKHDAKLQGAFKGYRNNQNAFKDKVLQEAAEISAAPLTLQELEKKAESVFVTTLTTESPVTSIDETILLTHETDAILEKRVIGKKDVDIAAMIKKLGNSDWVQQGRAFYEANEGDCPFCQQKTDEVFAQNLNEYFDEAFMNDSKAIDELATNYATEAKRIQQELVSIIASPSKFLDVEKLKADQELLNTKITLNNQHLTDKKREPSQIVKLESLSNAFKAIKTSIDDANAQVVKHNEMVTNLAHEQKTLTAQVWRFVIKELEVDLDQYRREKDNLEKAIKEMNKTLTDKSNEKNKKEAEIRELEKQATSIQPTVDGINSLLSSFGFQGFKLEKTASGPYYKLVRLNGSDAKTTLSEGEKTFVTFLYFYHLLKGSYSDSGTTTDRIVVFDDPVSSLDSDVLFIVSSLIKALFEDIRENKGHIKQIFVLTHNVYFHKEVTYNSKRTAPIKERFWVVRKSGLVTTIDYYENNPIKTSYELLWGELRKPDPKSLTIQNTLRRILENYFKILGDINFDELCKMFDGKDKLICKSLCSWIHDGSHYALDDLYVSIENKTVDAYLGVFRAIFEKSGHGAHYKMMMGDSYVEALSDADKATAPATEAQEAL